MQIKLDDAIGRRKSPATYKSRLLQLIFGLQATYQQIQRNLQDSR